MVVLITGFSVVGVEALLRPPRKTKGTMKDLNTNLLRHQQREQIKGEIEQAEDSLKHAKTDDANIIRAGMNKAKRMLQAGSPEPLTGKEKDTLAALEKKLAARIRENMPTEETMRKNPVGAVDHASRWEKRNKKIIRMWKNVRIQLNPESSERDLANVERLRPSGQMDRMRTDAQISGHMTYSDIPDELWPFLPPANTAAEQAKRAYETAQAENDVVAALDKMDSHEDPKDSAVETEEVEELDVEKHAQRVAILEKARAALKLKREEDKKLKESLEAVPDEQTV